MVDHYDHQEYSRFIKYITVPMIATPLGEGKIYIIISTIHCVIICNLCHNYLYNCFVKIYILYIQLSYISRLTLYFQFSILGQHYQPTYITRRGGAYGRYGDA